MKKNSVKTNVSFADWITKFFKGFLFVLIIPLQLYATTMSDSLKDDVTAMITNAKKLPHTTFILDTSESMNTFAYSDYIDTCADTLENISNAIQLCKNAFAQCRNIEANAMCDVDLGCDDVDSKCVVMQNTKATLSSFCNDLNNTYPEPGKKEIVSNPTATTNNKALKYVGPWNPAKSNYIEDICFYDWTTDTDGNVLEDTNSNHYTNPSGSGFDRRDWSCLTDGKGKMEDGTIFNDIEGVSGLWLNWKYATSLDAVKIILADTHSFSYPPTFRGKTRCMKTVYKPYRDDLGLGGTAEDPAKVCFREFETNPGPLDEIKLKAIRAYIRQNWTKEAVPPEGSDKTNCEMVDSVEVCGYPDSRCEDFSVTNSSDMENKGFVVIDTVIDSDGDADSVDALDKCQQCLIWDESSGTVKEGSDACSEYDGTLYNDETLKKSASVAATVDYVCCKTYVCTNPKCRDDDVSCFSDAGDCILGYYSTYDQDPEHCCDDITCIEEGVVQGDATTGFYCDSNISYIPGPSNSTTINTDVITLLPDPAPDYYDDVQIKVTTKDLSLNDYVEKVLVSVYYACLPDIDLSDPLNPKYPSIQIGSTKTYTLADLPVADDIIINGASLTGCNDTGYGVMGIINLYHNSENFEIAEAEITLEFGIPTYKKGSFEKVRILDPGQIYYLDYQKEITGAQTELVNEYECKTAFYHRQALVKKGSSCPSATAALAEFKLKDNTVDRCDPNSVEREVIDQDSWGNTEKVACSYLCRDKVVYDDPWKCQAFFYQMDAESRNGPDACGATCKDEDKLKECCQCISANQTIYNYKQLEAPEKVTFDGSPTKYSCSVSGYQNGITSSGKVTQTSGYMSEVIVGHIKEAGDASYKLNPYVNSEWEVDDGGNILYTPYSRENNTNWYSPLSLVVRGSGFIKDSFISVFKTSDVADRQIACIYDLMYEWAGEDCDMGGCDGGCCSVDLSNEDNGCDYPNFWMKIPNTNGGKHIFGSATLSGSDLNEFRNTVRSLKAVGGAALGETLYDVWRYLGGMYSLYDPAHLPSTGNRYDSPFENNPAECFINEAVIISGGQPHFDDNEYIATIATQPVPAILPYVETDKYDVPDPSKNKPYVERNWYLTAIENIAEFVHTEDFWHENSSCRADSAQNWYGYAVNTTSPCDSASDTTGKNVIDAIHSVAIGEWTLAPMYTGIKAGTNYLDNSVIRRVAEDNGGNYYGLSTKTNAATGDFRDLTTLFTDLLTQSRDTDVVSGRPHWTSSLVQPLGVEETVRGPEAYSAGAVPIDGLISRFWFGNLKKYSVDDDSSGCSFVAEATCGDWIKQTVPLSDCFYLSDEGTDMPDAPDFALLSAGGAAKKLEDKLTTPACNGNVLTPEACFKQSNSRNILYDLGVKGDLLTLKTANTEQLRDVLRTKSGRSEITESDAIQIFDYMYGFDSFDEYPKDNNRAQVRFRNMPKSTVTVLDPFDIDFDNPKEIEIRPLLLGAIIHSQPLAVYYEDTSNTRIFAGANDGMLHSFDQDGNEIFAYIPKLVFGSIAGFMDTTEGISFNATVDGPMTLLHIDQSHDGIINEGEKAYLIFGYRRGASGYTVIDISEIDNPKFVQNINTDGGLSFGKVIVFRKCNNVSGCNYADDLIYYIAVPGGYDTCYDPIRNTTSESDNTPLCPLNELTGNKFKIFNLDGDVFKEVNAGKYTYDSGDDVRQWFRVAFAASPFAVNTTGKFAVNTEFVYFTDLSGTVFRVDVRDNDETKWTASVVFTQRLLPGDIPWNDGIREYTATNYFPPQIQYPSYQETSISDYLIPISMVSGNMANPKAEERDKMIVFYDRKDGRDSDEDIFASTKYIDAGTDQTGNGGKPWTKEGTLQKGWKIFFTDPLTEKGITNPLIIYDVYGSKMGDAKNNYSLSWNTYVPKALTDCKNFGTSKNYQKLLVDGKQDQSGVESNINGAWDPAKCFSGEEISLATSVGVVATSDGYSLTFGAGADIFMKEELKVNTNIIKIIKWYELY